MFWCMTVLEKRGVLEEILEKNTKQGLHKMFWNTILPLNVGSKTLIADDQKVQKESMIIYICVGRLFIF